MTNAVKLAFVAVGDELVSGRILESNSARLAKKLEGLAVERVLQIVVRDEIRAISTALEAALALDAEVVLVSGGLGPTADDLTREALAAFAGKGLEWNDDAWKVVEEAYRRMAVSPIPETNRRQAMLPVGSAPLPNPVGTACGLTLHTNGVLFVALPGVPAEFETMLGEGLERGAWGQLFSPLGKSSVSIQSEYLLGGLGESAFEQSFGELFAQVDRNYYAICARRGLLEVRVQWDANKLEELEERFDRAFGRFLISRSVLPLEKQLESGRWPAGLSFVALEMGSPGVVTSALSDFALFRGGLVLPPLSGASVVAEAGQNIADLKSLDRAFESLDALAGSRGSQFALLIRLTSPGASQVRHRLELRLCLDPETPWPVFDPKTLSVLGTEAEIVAASEGGDEGLCLTWTHSLVLRDAGGSLHLGDESRERILGPSLATVFVFLRCLAPAQGAA